MGERFTLALASSSARVLIDQVLETAGLTDAFRVTLSTEEVPHGKPAPDVYLEAVSRLGLAPRVCAAVEDSSNGLRSAAAAGCVVIAIPHAAFPPAADALALRYGADASPAVGPWNEHIGLLLSHRSVRGFRPDALPMGTLETLIAAAQSAATSSNLQTWSVIAVTDPDKKAALAKVAANQKHIEQCPLFLVWVAFSAGQAAFKNNGQSKAANLAEWARDHYLGPVVTFGEWISYNPPKTGGQPGFSLAAPSGEAAAKTYKHTHGFVPNIPHRLASPAGHALPGSLAAAVNAKPEELLPQAA